MSNKYGSLGTQVFISTTQVDATTDTQGEYEALSWTEVGGTETMSKFGDSAQAVNFNGLTDGRVSKNKGARDAGDTTITVAHDPADAGQLALIAAEGTNKKYAFKVVLPDDATDSYTQTTIYFRGLVQSKGVNVGGANDTLRREFVVSIDSEQIEVPSSAS